MTSHTVHLMFEQLEPYLAGREPAPVRLHWHEGDPLAVAVTFYPDDPDVRPCQWWIGRDMLGAGLRRPVGRGDVRIGRDPATPSWLQIDLDTPDGSAKLRTLAGPIGRFLDATLETVRAGDEYAHADLDAEYARLLAGERAGGAA